MWQHLYDAPAPTLQNCSPSLEDQAITASIIKAGKLLNICVLDHLIIGGNTFVSLNRRGLAFDEDIKEIFSKKGMDERRVVAVSKPIPKIFQEIENMQSETAEKVKLVVDKQGTVVATTLDIKPQKRSKENEQS